MKSDRPRAGASPFHVHAGENGVRGGGRATTQSTSRIGLIVVGDDLPADLEASARRRGGGRGDGVSSRPRRVRATASPSPRPQDEPRATRSKILRQHPGDGGDVIAIRRSPSGADALAGPQGRLEGRPEKIRHVPRLGRAGKAGADLPQDLRLPEYHRLDRGRDAQEMSHRLAPALSVDALAPANREPLLDPHRVDLDSVAGKKGRRLANRESGERKPASNARRRGLSGTRCPKIKSRG